MAAGAVAVLVARPIPVKYGFDEASGFGAGAGAITLVVFGSNVTFLNGSALKDYFIESFFGNGLWGKFEISLFLKSSDSVSPLFKKLRRPVRPRLKSGDIYRSTFSI